MTLTAKTYEERTSLIACAIKALVHADTDDLDITFANGYTVGVYVCDHEAENRATVNIAIMRKGDHEPINNSDFISDYPCEFDSQEVQALLLNISRASTDFECGFAYARYIARTHE